MSVRIYKMKWGTTDYREGTQENVPERFERDNLQVVRTYYTPYNTRDLATKDFIGETRVKTIGSKKYPSRIIPHYHPRWVHAPFSAFPNTSIGMLHAVAVNHKGFLADARVRKEAVIDTSGGSPPNFLESEMSINYSSAPFLIMTDAQLGQLSGSPVGIAQNDESSLLRYVWGKQISSPKYQNLPRADAICWAYDNVPMSVEAAIILSEADVVIKWFNVLPELYNASVVDNLIGKCNVDDFGDPKFYLGKYKKGTLVFTLPDVEPFRHPTGPIYLDITYRFRYFPYGANYFYRHNARALANSDPLYFQNGVRSTGPGYYFAARKYGNVVKPETDPIYDIGGVGANLLVHPYGDFRDLFRA